MQWLMLQQEQPKDFVIATGQQYSVREFVTWCCEELEIDIHFEGSGLKEIGVVKKVPKRFSTTLKKEQIIVRVDPKYYRPAEVETLLGDASLARQELGWKPKITARELCSEMLASDLSEATKSKNYGNDP